MTSYLRRDLDLLIQALSVVANDLTSDPIDGATGGGTGGSTGGLDNPPSGNTAHYFDQRYFADVYFDRRYFG